MGFSGIGIWEVLVILIVVLLVLGPSRIPEVARTLGKAMRAFRKASADLTASVSRELEAEKKASPPTAADAKDKTPEQPAKDGPKEKGGAAPAK